MGFKHISIKLPADYSDNLLQKKIRKELQINEFTYQIENKSLDARKKSKIHWLLNVAVFSPEIKGEKEATKPAIEIKYKKRKTKVLVVGSGPAGFFSAFVLQKAGFQTTLIERGSEVTKRDSGIEAFEKSGIFNHVSNYAFGEGGAGTFSDGKLTSRSKHISAERNFITQSYIEAGAPAEIAWMAHPHLGTDNLKIIVKNLREKYIKQGGEILFETQLEDLEILDGKVKSAQTAAGTFEADLFILAPGHSAFETYRMLMKRNVPFRTKNFAIGSRMEHPQELINLSQWGVAKLAGVKAAEYRLSTITTNKEQVYSFCMCPGGIIVPSTAYENTNIVNGMSLFNRAAKFANAACVVSVNPEALMEHKAEPVEVLDWLQNLEESFYDYSNGYKAPACRIQDFIDKKESKSPRESSYPFGLKEAPLWELLPEKISEAMREGLKDFSKKMKGFEQGNLLGLESKTSSPIQVIRDKSGLCDGFENLYIVGEGSGYAGGIMSSAADGIKAAMGIVG